VRRSRLLVREAARLGEAGDASALVAIMESKVAATEAAAEVTGRALEVTGGQGYTPSLPIERHLRDARAGAVMAPTNAVLRNWIGKALAGLPVP
jgi:isovaleryl-CoA dehydrogenase